MKPLIVFYSLTGNTKKIAQAVAEAAAGEVIEIKIKREIPDKGFWRYFLIGAQAIKKPVLRPLDKNPADYDLVFLGGPVWAGNFAPAIRSFLSQAKLKDKKIALFCAHGGEDADRAFIGLEKELAANEIVGKIDFKMDGITEAKLSDNLWKAREWAKGIVGK
jgi:flavodoxin